jgi:hypothetical protein
VIPTGLPPALAIPFDSFRFNNQAYNPNSEAFDGPNACGVVAVQSFGMAPMFTGPLPFRISFSVVSYERQPGVVPAGMCAAL